MPPPSAHGRTEAFSAGSDNAAGEGEETGETRILRHLKLPTAPLPLAAPREMWESESYELIPLMDEHGIDERDLAGIDDDTLIMRW